MKKRICAGLFAAAAVVLLGGCGAVEALEVPEKNTEVITVWNYYNGTQLDAFRALVRDFNNTVGLEKGIVVESVSKGSISELYSALEISAEKKNGAEELPDVCAAYADTAYEFKQRGMLVNLKDYISEEELGEYVISYLNEGYFDGSNELSLLPVAKSTEVLTLDVTDWETFAKETGSREEELSTWEGIAEVAKRYYEWTDAMTETPDDGRAFFGRDAFANYMIIGSRQLGHSFCAQTGEGAVVSFDKDTARRLWDCYYVPYINGYYAARGKFRSDDMKTGDLIAYVGSTSAASYTPSSVSFDDGSSYEITCKVLPVPNFEGTEPSAVQQGAGMMVFSSYEEKEQAAVEFLRWLTEAENNLRFCVESGYLPVKTEANNRETLDEAIEKNGLDASEALRQNLYCGMDITAEYELYTTPAFEGGQKFRTLMERGMTDKANQDREEILAMMKDGIGRAEAVAAYDTDENFNRWYENISDEIMTIGE